MKFLKYIKYSFLFLLIFLLGAQTTYAKTAIGKSLKSEYAKDALENQSLWKRLNEDKISTFREIYKDYDGDGGINPNKNYTKALFLEITSKSIVFTSKVKILTNSTLLTPSHFYDLNTDAVINEGVYTLLDGIGIIPGADLFTDPVGAIFAFIRGDTENGVVYTASAVIPLGGAAYIKGGRKAIGKFDDMYKVVAKKTDNADDFTLIYKKFGDKTAKDELHISSVFHSVDSKIKDNIPAEDLRKYIDKDYIEHQLAKKVVDAGRKITTSELALLKRADLPDFVSNNLDDLLLAENRTAIWNLNNVSSGQFKRGDLIEEIFNQWSKKYGGYQNLNDIIPNYRTLDFDGVLANVNEVVSLKSFKPISNNTLSNFKSTVRSNMKKLNDDVAIGTNHTGKSRVLDFTIEKGAWSQSQIDDVYDYIEDLLEDKLKFGNVSEVRITEF